MSGRDSFGLVIRWMWSHWCKSCELCASKKNPPKKGRAKLKNYVVGAPLKRVEMDILGPLPRSNSGNKYILVICDWFTKWTEAYAMPNQEAETCAKILVNQFICKMGIPHNLQTDQGRQFESRLFQEVCRLLDVKKIRSSPLHPITQGLVERYNRTLESMLSMFVSRNQKDWDKFLPMVMLAYRSTAQESTGYSPNRLMLGRELTLPVDIMFGQPSNESDCDSVDYEEDLRNKLERAYEHVRINLRKAASRQKGIYDKRVSGTIYEEGDKVWLFVPYRKKSLSPKLQRFWEGPFTIRTKNK